ncbi:uncharacterized protein LOC134845133 [Symsagittifera roscoffensis]|uniref:uncharacterized protein LOC134845133 n=1 Tax=Symsagittifera roscoffensis TaxID=84072 RepID=UPI00307BFD66
MLRATAAFFVLAICVFFTIQNSEAAEACKDKEQTCASGKKCCKEWNYCIRENEDCEKTNPLDCKDDSTCVTYKDTEKIVIPGTCDKEEGKCLRGGSQIVNTSGSLLAATFILSSLYQSLLA